MANLSDKVSQGTVPAAELTKRTKVLDENDVTITATNLSSYIHSMVAYADSDDNWRLKFNMELDFSDTVASRSDIKISGATFATRIGLQALIVTAESTATADDARGFIVGSTNSIVMECDVTRNGCEISGDIELASKPTWADANMENEIAVNAYIPEATSTEAGVVKANKWEKHTLTTDLTASDSDNSDLRFNNLTIGKMYRVSLQGDLRYTETSGQDAASIAVTNNSVEIVKVNHLTLGSFSDYAVKGSTGIFSAAATTVIFNCTITNTAEIKGTQDATWAILEELNNYEAETADFT